MLCTLIFNIIFLKSSVMDKDGAVDSWRVYHQFQSHDQEFDYLKSLEIEEKINHIQWCKPVGENHFIFTTNGMHMKLFTAYMSGSFTCENMTFLPDKTVKLWKIGPRSLRFDQKKRSSVADGVLSIRKEQSPEQSTSAALKKTYANAHTYHINSISCNSDGETFLSADDLRINWWNKEISSSSFSKLHKVEKVL